MKKIDRRRFIAASAGAAGMALIPSITFSEDKAQPTDLVKALNGEPLALVKQAVEALGGMSRFVSKGDRVLVKPNIGWDRNPAQAANTHPDVVAETVRLCLEAGAKEVQVFDRTCNSSRRCYRNSGIEKAAKEAGAKVSFVMDRFFKDVKIENGYTLKKWPFYQPALEMDKYINLPILKNHGLAGLTVGMKNIMGVIGGRRGLIHQDFDLKIVDLNMVIKPDLNIVDATRILRRNGPTGGSLGDVEEMNTVIAGTDIVAVDAAAAKLFGYPVERLGYLTLAERKGLGKTAAADNITTIDLAG